MFQHLLVVASDFRETSKAYLDEFQQRKLDECMLNFEEDVEWPATVDKKKTQVKKDAIDLFQSENKNKKVK